MAVAWAAQRASNSPAKSLDVVSDRPLKEPRQLRVGSGLIASCRSSRCTSLSAVDPNPPVATVCFAAGNSVSVYQRTPTKRGAIAIHQDNPERKCDATAKGRLSNNPIT